MFQDCHLSAEAFAVSDLSITGAIIGNHNLGAELKHQADLKTGRYLTLPSSPTAENPFFQKATSFISASPVSKNCLGVMLASFLMLSTTPAM